MDVGHTLKLALFIALGMLSAAYVFGWARSVRARRADKQPPNESESSGAPTLARSPGDWIRHEFLRHAGHRLIRDLDAIRWRVMAVIVYTAVTMLRSASAERRQAQLLIQEAGD
jgi:hypothetical protein